MKITVTRDHIRRGLRWSCLYCPVALAIRGAIAGTEASIFADVDEIRVNGRAYPTPRRARTFMRRLDDINDIADRKQLRQFSFELPIGESD